MLTCIHDFLTNRHHKVTLEDTYSEVHTLISGVPKGESLFRYYSYVISMIYQPSF